MGLLSLSHLRRAAACLVVIVLLFGACTSEGERPFRGTERAPEAEPTTPSPGPQQSPTEEPGRPKKPGGEGPVTVAAAGDISEAEIGDQQATSDLVLDADPDHVLVLGDAQYPNGSPDDFAAYYEPTWGRFKDRTSAAPGNHDKYGPSGYDEYFDPPGAWYSFDLGAWHFVSLDSNQADDPDQHSFLDEDLEADDHLCEIAYWHHARFSSGSDHGSDQSVQPLWKRAVDNGVDLVLTSHEHVYERFGRLDREGRPDSDGTVQIIVGTGGGEQHDDFFDEPEAGSKVRVAQEFGILFLKLGKSSYSGVYRTVEGRILDRFEKECR
jgi:hypothetical protein